MKSMKQTIGYLRSVQNGETLGLILALMVTLWAGEVAFAATRTINLNTGYDQWAASPALIPVGGGSTTNGE